MCRPWRSWAAELGFKGAELDIWFGLWTPNGTPADVTARMAKEVARALALPTTKARYESLGAEPVGLDNAEFRSLLASETKQLSTLIRDSRINIAKYGVVKTDHILFIASGAFHLAKPSDLIPELQGRFPIRVELQSLSVDDFEAILTQTLASLVRQYQALLETEGVTLSFAPEGIRQLAQIACDVNERTENFGARRLATVMERLLDEVSFDASNLHGQAISIDAAYVNSRLAELGRNEDLSRYIL